MSGIDITIKLDSADLEATLDRAIAEGDDLRLPMAEIGEEWLALVRQRFTDQKDPLGVPWKKRRGNIDPERATLHSTGALEMFVRPDTGKDFAQVGVEKSAGPGVYARIHNEGGEIRPKKGKALKFKQRGYGERIISKVVMPKRQFVGFGPNEQNVVEDVMGDWLRRLFRAGA